MTSPDEAGKRTRLRLTNLTKKKRKGLMGALVVFTIATLLIGGVGYQIWSYYVVDQQFNNTIKGYFDLSDQSSNATTKLHYWNLFVHALETNHLDQGWAVNGGPFCLGCDKNQAYNLTNVFAANALTIQSRLKSLVDSCRGQNDTCQSSFSFTQSLNQIELTEVCWFPINYFKQGFEMQNHLFLSGLTAPSNDYLCSTSTKT